MKNLKHNISGQRPGARGPRENQPPGLRSGFTLVDPGSESGVTSLHKGFTLVELMIVVAVLGILAAIVIPEFSGHIQKAKESAAKDTLRIFRETILRYAAEHNGVPPGYNLNDTSQISNVFTLQSQLFRMASNSNGELAAIGTAGYPYGPYFSEIPKNPFNGLNGISLISNGGIFPTEPAGTSGWYYKPQEKEIRLNWPGTDSEGVAYYSY